MSPEELGRLSARVEHFIQLEVGRQLPYVGLLFDPEGQRQGLALFTNRRSDAEVRVMLEDALRALEKSPERFVVYEE